jgi:tungstate transport system permease protein
MPLNADLASIVLLTLRVSFLALGASALLGVPVGAWLGVTRFRGHRLVLALVNTAMGLPPVIVGLVVYLLLSQSGPLAPLDWLFTPHAMVLAQLILCLPIVVGITASSVASVPRELLLQLRSLGATEGQARRALVREARSGIVVAIAAAFGRSTSEVGAVLIVGGNIAGHTRVLTTAIVLETGQGNFSSALALGACLLGLAIAANVIILRAHGRILS